MDKATYLKVVAEAYDRATCDLCAQSILDQSGSEGPFEIEACGDGLALFVLREAADVFSSGATDMENIQEARRALGKASGELALARSSLTRIYAKHLIETLEEDE